MPTIKDAATLVAEGMAERDPRSRVQFCKALMANAAAAIVKLDGKEAAAESAYRLADAIVARTPRP